jgi:hypothetical protein
MKLLIVCVLSLVFGYVSLLSDNRNFVWTYEYLTMEEGAAEVEQYMTFNGLENFESKGSRELNIEYEFGMSDGFDFAIYQNFKQSAGGAFSWDGFKARFRKKLAKENAWWFSPLLYVEYKASSGATLHSIETKLILERKFGDFTLALNPYFEYEQEKIKDNLGAETGGKEWEFVPKYALGLNYDIARLFSFGFEAKGSESGHYIGPALSHGEHDLWVSFGYLWGVDVAEGKPEQMARLIFGIEINSPEKDDSNHKD